MGWILLIRMVTTVYSAPVNVARDSEDHQFGIRGKFLDLLQHCKGTLFVSFVIPSWQRLYMLTNY